MPAKWVRLQRGSAPVAWRARVETRSRSHRCSLGMVHPGTSRCEDQRYKAGSSGGARSGKNMSCHMGVAAGVKSGGDYGSGGTVVGRVVPAEAAGRFRSWFRLQWTS